MEKDKRVSSAVIEKERELEALNIRKALAIERPALSKRKDGEAEAAARERKVSAENCIDSRLLHLGA